MIGKSDVALPGAGLLLLPARIALLGAPAGLVAAHLVILVPLVQVTLAAAVARLNPGVARSAASLGAEPWRRLRRVVVSMMLFGLVAAMALACLVSSDEPVVALFLTRHDPITPSAQVFTDLPFRADPTIAALSTMTGVLSLLAMGVADRTVGLDRIMGFSP